MENRVEDSRVSKKNRFINLSTEKTRRIFFQGHKFLLCLNVQDEAVVCRIASEHNLSMPVARVLYSRGFTTSEAIVRYLFPSLEKDVPHPSLLKDADIAVDRIMRAIEAKEKILVFGDYDVDGITSSALMMVCLLPLGANINFFLPHRQRDGYGLSSKVVTKAKENGYKLIITVDNGITAFEAVQTAVDVGIDVLITDHHRPHQHVPKALAIVNPNQVDCSYPTKELCGVGVIFKLISWIYERKRLALPEKAYEMLMLGTIADVVPLVRENRFWVSYGLSKVNKCQSYAMQVLTRNSKITAKSRLSSRDMGFMVAPQLNALGRLSDPRDAVKFLISAQREDVDRIGRVLWETNEVRRQVERAIFEEICLSIEGKQIDFENENIITVAKAGWPAGVLGLVAGKLVQRYGRPSFVFYELEDGTLKGSCRSIKEFNVFDALTENKELLLSFGGHSFAAGMHCKKENLPILKKRLEQKIACELSPFDLLQKVNVDASLPLAEINKRLLTDLEKLEPFGNQNEQPTFLVKNVMLLQKPKFLRERHVKCMLFSEGIIKPVIFFNRPELYAFFNEIGDKRFHVAGSISSNEWKGRTNIELIGTDVALAD